MTLNEITVERVTLPDGAAFKMHGDRIEAENGDTQLDTAAIGTQMERLAAAGYRVLAFAEGKVTPDADIGDPHALLKNLTFLGLAGMIDPLRPEAKEAVAHCHEAGISIPP